MALQGPISIDHDQVFPHGAFAVGEVTQVDDFDKSSKENRVQQVDKNTGLRMWQVRVMDPDPEARKGQGEVTVKLLADVCPSLPDAVPGMPFRPGEFTGMTVTPYIDERGARGRLAFSFKATGVQAPSKGARTDAKAGAADAKSGDSKAA